MIKGMDQWPEPLRRRWEQIEREDPLDRVRNFLGGHFADADSLEEVEAGLRRVASYETRGITRDLRALEVVLSRPLEPGLPTWLVGWEANWVLDEPNDENSLEFLRKVADMLRVVVASARTDQWLELLRRLVGVTAHEPLDRVRNFLAGYFAAAESFEKITDQMTRRAAVSTIEIERDLRAFETVLSQGLDPGVPLRIVSWDANWVLDEPDDENSLEFLRKVADMLRTVLAEA